MDLKRLLGEQHDMSLLPMLSSAVRESQDQCEADRSADPVAALAFAFAELAGIEPKKALDERRAAAQIHKRFKPLFESPHARTIETTLQRALERALATAAADGGSSSDSARALAVALLRQVNGCGAEAELITRERWRRSTLQRPLELINPAESFRRYSDHGAGLLPLPGQGSMVGSKGEWKVASADRSRWVALDIGSPRRVVAIVLQCGELTRAFSGWVTRLRVHYSTSEHFPSEEGTHVTHVASRGPALREPL